MQRPIRTIIVAIASLAAGACAGRLHVVSQPLSAPVAIGNSVAAEPMPAVLTISQFSLSDLLPATAFAASEPVMPEPRCNPLTKIDEVASELAPASLSVGTVEYRYTEVRGGRKTVFRDPEKQIALGLLNLDTCTTRTVIITKKGNQLIAPAGWDVEAVTRRNGIQWNNWATEFKIHKPAGWFVIGLQWPVLKEQSVTQLLSAASGKVVRKTTKQRVVTSTFYTPHNEELHTPESVAAGEAYTKDISQKADDALRIAGVHSQAYPDMLVSDVPALKREYVERRLPMENMDQGEFLKDREWTTERIYTVIGTNGDRFAVNTCSPAGACGARQFIAGTWKMVQRIYGEAHLSANFTEGARDPLQAAQAARLLDDYNLAELKGRLSVSDFAKLIGDPQLTEEALDAAYNTGVVRVVAVLKAFFAHPGKYADWIDAKGPGPKGHFVAETKGYIQLKLRYLRDEWTNRQLTRADTTPGQ